jgi:HTH-type transcriptional regulator, transcriptional repressor of NAD biosynthesis genes
LTFGTAVVIGKFYPPHRGHHYLIDIALARSRQVTVIVCARADDTIPGELRRRWLQEVHPAATVMLVDDEYDPHDSALWAALTIRWLGHVPDAAFTSEEYGERWAGLMGCAHVLVDQARITVPCSGTMIRADPAGQWHCLEPPVRAWFARRVCILGAESTGTTTLADALAQHYRTIVVGEYGREYFIRKMQRGDATWTSDEFVHIAEEQSAREERAAREANRILICDTNAYATRFWHRRYTGRDDERVDAATVPPRCALYVLTGDEIPFVQDGFRDGEHVRHVMHRWFEEALRAQPVPWLVVRGPHATRMAQAIAAIDGLP